MRKSSETPIIKLSEKYDKQLLKILSEELRTLKEANTQLIKKLIPRSDDGFLVA